MTTPSDEPTTDICQCTKVKEACESEGDDPGTTVICPGCHLEEATAKEREEQEALPDDKRIYAAFKNSPSLMRIAAQEPGEQSIRLVIRKRQKGQQSSAKDARKLVKEYGTTPIVTSLKGMLSEGVFTCTDVAKRRFPDLFPKEQVSNHEEGQESAAGRPSTKDMELLGGECNQLNEEAGDSRGNHSFPNLEHACFSFAQREMQQALDRNDHSCAESISLQTWIDLFQNNKTFETEDNAESLSNLLRSVGKIQNIAIHRLDLNFFQANQFLLNAEEFIRLLDTPMYLDAVKPLRERIGEVLLMADRATASINNEADGKVAEIEAQRERLNREEEDVKRVRSEGLNNIRDSIERDIFAAMRQAKDALPDIGLAENR
ncbi:uncharacterized protein FIESC28_11381 [Fusarium coffeatum]|uniref:Uncharacterized protein n=1 Tax=Fusarium coffeatum TaxID=231269 RepID=A0A366QKB7_9HYPO|nr:uncharacterized protein FIESC28_11381 [Fusarium coffeatum]RBR05323.1 hypothetical protein FIESC28_11381 [Fusarium coffeatum]